MAFLLTNSQSHVIPHQHSTNDIIWLIQLIEDNAVVVSASAPANPTAGKLWYNTTKWVFNIYNGSAWILVGPEVTPITKSQYDALSSADKNDGRFYLITDNDWTILVEWDNVLNKPLYVQAVAPTSPVDWYLWYDTTNHILKAYNTNAWEPVDTDTTYSAWDGIDIDANNNNAISVDVTDIIGTWLSEDANNNIIVDTSIIATQQALTNWLSTKQDTINDLATIRSWASAWATALQPLDNVSALTNDAGYITNAVSDLTNYYTKTQTYTKTEVDNIISDFGGFEVVSTLPTASSANTHIIYLLGPIGTWGDKYEEWIVTENTMYVLETLDENNPTVNISTPYTLAATDCSATYESWDVHTIGLISGWNNLWAYIGSNKFLIPGEGIVMSPTIDVPAWELSTSWFESYTSITLPVPAGTTKTWTKIWDTSVDLSNCFNTVTDTSDDITQWSNNLFVSSSEKSTWDAKQDALTAWDNITISSNTISADVNVKKFPVTWLASWAVLSEWQAIVDYIVAWKLPKIVFGWYEYNYIGYNSSDDSYYFQRLNLIDVWTSTSNLQINSIKIETDGNGTVTGLRWPWSNNWVLLTNYNYATPYTPTYAGSPATKKYVDDSIDAKVISSSTTPSSPTEWMLWYDTTNDVLKVYDGTNFVAVDNNTTYSAWDGIDINSNTISVDVTDIVGTWLSEDSNNNIIVDYDAVAQALAWTWLEYNGWSSAIDVDYDTVWQALAWTWLSYNGWDEQIEIDTTVVATQTDLSWKQDKATSWNWAPSTTPTYIWQEYVDTTNNLLYIAKWTTSSSDWIVAGKTYSAWDWIDIDASNNISVDVTDIIWTWLTEDANNNIIIDTTVVATQTDLSNIDQFTPESAWTTGYVLKKTATGYDWGQEWNDETAHWFSLSFSGTSAYYSNANITANSIVVWYNFEEAPVWHITFSVETWKLKVESTSTESSLPIKLLIENNPWSFTALTADV